MYSWVPWYRVTLAATYERAVHHARRGIFELKVRRGGEFHVQKSVARVRSGVDITSMNRRDLPSQQVMLRAFMERDSSFDGVFFTGVRTTGIFCRPGCPARTPRPENLCFFPDVGEALHAGYRPCLRCRPLEQTGEPPAWLRPLLEQLEADPTRRWTDEDVRARGLSPERVRRWFKSNHGMTFQAYSRARRLGSALGRMQEGDRVGRAAFEAGYESLSGFQDAFRRYFGDPPTEIDTSVVVSVTRVPTPLGPMLMGCTDGALCLLEFVDRRMLPRQIQRIRRRLGAVFVPGENAVTREAAGELTAWFEGDLRDFSVPVLSLGSPFQLRVWEELRRVPYGETASYGDIAARVERPEAVRAVGTANGANAIAVVVPCHRVIGADGRLSGYGGGVWRKRRLLDLEREHCLR
jgi:AraC family transcriptional regulator of adaptative response/methylated-DNA-[protein]-cysteine methyltransferase